MSVYWETLRTGGLRLRNNDVSDSAQVLVSPVARRRSPRKVDGHLMSAVFERLLDLSPLRDYRRCIVRLGAASDWLERAIGSAS
jgi:hypothetical protein